MNQQPFSPFGGGGRGGPNMDLGPLIKRYSKLIVTAVVILVLIIIGVKAAYQVEPDEVGVVKRFGRFHAITDPGLHFRIPLVDDVETIPAKRQLKQEFGFMTEAAGVQTSYRRDANTLNESMMLTGDLNVAVIEWIVHYQISDPYNYTFKVRNVTNTLRALSEATMRKVVGDYSVTEVLTRGREEVLGQARQKLQELCTSYETGLSIQRLELKDSAPPNPVKPSFNEVNQAEQERDRMYNEARAQYNKVIPRARGEAKQVIEEAEGFAVERVNRAKGDVAWFVSLQREYASAPRVTRARLYLEALTEVLPQAGRKVYLDEGLSGAMPMLFPMGDGGGLAGAGKGGAR